MLRSIYVVPGYTFFYWGFTLPKKDYPEFINEFGLRKNPVKEITLRIRNKTYRAKLQFTRITSAKYPNRDVVRITYENEHQTLKALRRLFIYSYAATIDKKKPKLKELMELEHAGGNEFLVKAPARQETDLNAMLLRMEDKGLFEYARREKKGKQKNFFVNFTRRWLPVSELKSPAHQRASNVVYVLYHSQKQQLYVGKADVLGKRVKRGHGRRGLHKDWDRFMYFEIDPEFGNFSEHIEAFMIRGLSLVLENDVGMEPLEDEDIRLVNRSLRNH